MITLYNAVSRDGYIADKDKREDFIPDDAWNDFLSLLPDYDTLVISRATYETIRAYPKELIEELERTPIKRIVLTTNQSYPVKEGYTVIHTLDDIPSQKSVLVTSGPTLNDALIRGKLVQDIIRSVIPVTLSDGLPQFTKEPTMPLVTTRSGENGRIWEHYRVE